MTGSRRTARTATGRRGAMTGVLVLGLVAAACGNSSTTGASHSGHAPHSIVQLGDSVASGEGTLYGYTYDSATREWTGGNIDATWPGPYPLCHVSPDAYGNLVAAKFHARLSQFACSGASFENGIVTAQKKSVVVEVTLRPAQFGNWTTKTNLNPGYDAAHPDLVLVTLGADDVQFSSIVRSCVESNLFHQLDPSTSLQCTSSDPGATVQKDDLSQLSTLARHLTTLAHWIVSRGMAAHTSPKVVFTNYFDPLPKNNANCPDTQLLATAQLSYLSGRLGQLDRLILKTVNGLHDPDIKVVDLQSAFDGHRWCSSDPWDYGLSIFKLSNPSSLLSDAPFHPTPRGQQQIASLVEPTVERLFSGS